MPIDKTKRPLRIPPQFQLYAEEHGIFDVYHRMLQRLLIDKPHDPLDYMINWLRRESDVVPKISVIGGPSSGKKTVARKLADNFGAVLVKPSELATTDEEIISEIKAKVSAPGSEPVRRGYVLLNVPKSKKQALLLQQAGVHPQHILSLDAPENVLLGRRLGKYEDKNTGQVYHNVFDWPSDTNLQSQLTKASNANKESFERDMLYWNREKVGIFDAYASANTVRHFSSDQPQHDVYNQAYVITSQPCRSDAVTIPRIVLLGAPGAGKKTIANTLAKKYKTVLVDADAWVKIIAEDKSSTVGDAVRQFHHENGSHANLPDELMVRCVSERLSRIDCQTKGWIMYGFPKTALQVEQINLLGHRPNRVFSLELPLDAAVERLSHRRVDPQTGNRYHLLWETAENEEILERLVRAPWDQESAITSRWQEYMKNVDSIKYQYREQERQLEKPVGGVVVTINADQNLQTVLEYSESFMVNPVPLETKNNG